MTLTGLDTLVHADRKPNVGRPHQRLHGTHFVPRTSLLVVLYGQITEYLDMDISSSFAST